jgi:hypothetical protein
LEYAARLKLDAVYLQDSIAFDPGDGPHAVRAPHPRVARNHRQR